MSFFSIALHLAIAISQLPSSRSDSANLIYKGCANQTFHDPNGQYAQSVSSLFGALVSASTKSKFYKTTAGSGQTSIMGLFQCRGDLSANDCYSCVSNLPVLTEKICGTAIAARIQLDGCYLLYEVSGFTEVSGMQILYKVCGAGTKSGGGFEEKRDTAFNAIASGVVTGHGFFSTNYQSVYALAQCEGDVSDADCGACVTTAVQRAQVECGNSVAGQIYLSKCYITYNYSPGKAPDKPTFSSPTNFESKSPGSDQNTGRTVAIIVGAAAGVGFLVICLMFVKGMVKNDD